MTRSSLACLVLCLTQLASLPANSEDPSDDSAANIKTEPSANPVRRIVFGSCIKQDREIPILSQILAEQPQLVLLTGDNIYGDTEDILLLRKKYQRLTAHPKFAELKKSARLLATWDDHDYGVNDGGASYSKRQESRNAFLDFMDVAGDSPRRHRDGVYHSVTVGPQGQRLQIILLDTRFNRSELKQGKRRVGGPYYPDPSEDKTILGERQWEWLEKRLLAPADIRLVVSSIQFVATDAGQECWANLPAERRRMLRMIHKTQANGIVFLSGDRHWSEISSLKPDGGYRLYDITCSSLNQDHPRGTPTENRLRLGTTTYHHMNYGLLQIDWQHPNGPLLKFSIRDLDGKDRITLQLRQGDLKF